MKYLINNVCIKCTNTNRFDKYLPEDLKSDTTSNLFINEVNSLNIKLGLRLVHTFTFVTSLLKKACIWWPRAAIRILVSLKLFLFLRISFLLFFFLFLFFFVLFIYLFIYLFYFIFFSNKM